MRAMCQVCASPQDPDDICRSIDAFKCEVGYQITRVPHNLTELLTIANVCGRKKELSKLYTDLKRMVDRGEG